MTTKNPYTISFGKIPNKYLHRTAVIDSIIEEFDSDSPDEQVYKLTGIRGTGKTVTLTAIERHFRESEDWIVVDIPSGADIATELVARLYSQVPFITKFVDASLNLSAFGIGLNISQKSPVASINYALEVLIAEVLKRKKRVLITIDEAQKTKSMIDFIQEFQILIRKELPIYLVMAGLYEDIESLENAEGLTFLLRSTKYEMPPLNITYIRDDYQKTLGISYEEAEKMAFITKGYAYAYQTLGKYMWDSNGKELTEEVLRRFDDMLADKVYKKIWSELAPNDKLFLRFIAQKDSMPVSELLELTKKKHSDWAIPRERLNEKGIIDVQNRGVISIKLPRFKEFVDAQIV
jgi:predicted AAA+ superfamily ATPase